MNGSKVRVRVARCLDIPIREGRAVKIGTREIAIFNLGERFLAVENRCPHKAGPLADGIVSGDAVVCPLHAWRFSLETGEGLSSANGSSCVETFRTIVQDGTVLLELNKDPRNEGEPVVERLPALCIDSSSLPAVSDMPVGS